MRHYNENTSIKDTQFSKPFQIGINIFILLFENSNLSRFVSRFNSVGYSNVNDFPTHYIFTYFVISFHFPSIPCHVINGGFSFYNTPVLISTCTSSSDNCILLLNFIYFFFICYCTMHYYKPMQKL